MADTPAIVVEYNGYRELVLRTNLISDGGGLSGYTFFDATSATYGVNKAGQTFLVGTNVTIVEMGFDVQAMLLTLLWDADTDQSIFTIGTSPDVWNFSAFGGLKVPDGLTGATGSIKLTTTGAAAGDSFSLWMRLRKNIPAS